MKTTLDLPDDLLMEVKAMAAKRRTTLKAMVEHALRREIDQSQRVASEADSPYEMNELGYLVLKRRNSAVSHDTIGKLQDEIDEEELNHALKLAGKR